MTEATIGEQSSPRDRSRRLLLRDGWRLVRSRLPLLALSLVLLVFSLAPLLVGIDPLHQRLIDALQAPSSRYWLGTDQFGRDIFSRVIFGARTSLYAAMAVIGVTFIVGTIVGVGTAVLPFLAGRALSSLIDFLLGVPGMVVALAVVGALGPGTVNLIVALSVIGWSWYARLAEEHARQILADRVVMTARVSGVPPLRYVAGHVVPHVSRRLLVVACLDLGYVVLAIAGLNYLGLGAQPPAPELGEMLHDGQSYVLDAPWMLVGPCVALVAMVLPFVAAGEHLQSQGVRV